MATPLLLCIQISVILFSECEWRPRSVINQCHHPMVLLVDCAACSILAFSGRYGQHTYDTNTRHTPRCDEDHEVHFSRFPFKAKIMGTASQALHLCIIIYVYVCKRVRRPIYASV